LQQDDHHEEGECDAYFEVPIAALLDTFELRIEDHETVDAVIMLEDACRVLIPLLRLRLLLLLLRLPLGGAVPGRRGRSARHA